MTLNWIIYLENHKFGEGGGIGVGVGGPLSDQKVLISHNT